MTNDHLLTSLTTLRRQVKLLGVAFGLAIVIAIAAGGLLATILLDYLLNLPPIPRLAVMTLAGGAIFYSMMRWLARPFLSHLTLSDVAGRVESAFPEFSDRLRSTVDFARQDIPGSQFMKDRVISEAAGLAQKIDLRRALVWSPVRRALSAAILAIGLLWLLIALAGPQYRTIALSRLLRPFNALPWPKRVEIALINNPPLRVPVGQRVEVKMRLLRGDRPSLPALIHYRYGQGPVQQEFMTRTDDGVYAASLDARAESSAAPGQLTLWMTAGDDTRELLPIQIVPRLAINRIEAIVTPPAYTHRPPLTANLSAAPAVVVDGSQLALHVWFNKPLAPGNSTSLVPVSGNAKIPPIAWSADSPSSTIGHWTALDSLRFHVRGADADGFTNSALEEYNLVVRPDQTPTVQIENPRRTEDRTPAATLPLQILAEDDYGLKSAKLIINRLGDKKHWELDLLRDGQSVSPAVWSDADASAQRQRLSGNYPWELPQLANADLKSGDVLEYFVQVQDNFALSGATHAPVSSGKLRLNIITQEELTARLTEELRTLASQITDLRKRQDRTHQETADLNQETASKSALDAADRAAAERLVAQQGVLAAQTRQTASRLQAMRQRLEENRSTNAELKSLTADVADQLNQTAESPMKEAGSHIAAANQSRQSTASRNQSFAQAAASQQQASRQLQKALDRLGNIGSLQQTLDALRELLNQQQQISTSTSDVARGNLGKTLEQMSPDDRKRLEEIARQQEALAQRTTKAMEDMQKSADQLAKSDPASSEAMKQAHQTGQQQQVSPNQFKAAQHTRQNQQSSAQSAQRQAELGLEMMLNNLRDAQRRQLEELARQLEEIQQQLANLIRRQAGHNLDNLICRNALSRLDRQTLTTLLTQAERTPDPQPPIPKNQLPLSQEQTERNTRDIASAVESTPGGAEPAAHLVKAAGRMERAIISLRQDQLADAYDPPQVEALSLLIEAKRHIDQQKDKVDQERQQQDKETIRQAYVKIRDDQDKLNRETRRIDSAPRAAAGRFKREDLLRLNQLPPDQGALADRTQKLGQDLASLGSIVYVWANKDVIASMNAVKADLANQSTGQPTQAEQARILEQLDAMIANLAIKPSQERFANRGGGGGNGGGAGAPILPPEVELRLLRDLQLAINKITRTLDAQPNRDKEKLLSLAQRQGDLRQLLDTLLQKSSQGQTKLNPEPDPKDRLPEEVGSERAQDQDLEQDLLNNQPPTAQQVDQGVNGIGDRMARSRQRLALNNDPGKTTQLIQDHIIKNLQDLIRMARTQQASASASPSKNQPRLQLKLDPQAANPQSPSHRTQPQPGKTPAARSTLSPGGNPAADLSQDIKQTMREWGGLTQRQRDAVIEGSSETVIEKYKKLVDDYYRSLSSQSPQRQQ